MPLNAQGYIGMKFKFKNTLLVSFLAIAGILGVSSALICNNVHSFSIQKAEASSVDWFIVGSGYSNGASLSWDTGCSGMPQMAKSDNDPKMSDNNNHIGYIKASLKAGTTFKIHYKNGDGSSWKGYNEGSTTSGSVAKNGTYFTSSDGNFYTQKDGVYNIWLRSDYTVGIGVVSNTIGSFALNPTTMRYWFIQNQSSFWNKGTTSFGVHVWDGTVGSSGTNAYYVCNAYYNGPNNTGNVFRYVDIPGDCTKISFLRYAGNLSSGSNISIWNESAPYDISKNASDDWSRTKLHILNSWNPNIAYNQSVTFSHQNATGTYDDNTLSASAYLLSYVLSDYPTCVLDSSEYTSIKSVWWDTKDDSLNGKVASVTMWDYTYDAYHAAGDKYTSSQGVSESETITVQEKWTALSNMISSGNPNHAASRNFTIFNLVGEEGNISTVIIVIASSVALLSVTALSILVIRKRKTKEQ